MKPMRLFANGTVKAAFLRAQDPRARAGDPRRSLLDEAVSAFDLDRDVVALAAELVEGCVPPELDRDDQHALLLLAVAALIGVRDGSTRLGVRGAAGESQLQPLLAALSGEPNGSWRSDIEALIAEARVPNLVASAGVAPLVLEGDFLYLERLLALERSHAARLAARLNAASDETGPVLAALEAIEAEDRGPGAFQLSSQQRAGIIQALSRRLTVITGGPGTGKTSMVVALVRTALRLAAPNMIALAAPTGKAANRLKEAVGGQHPTHTIHRLLDYSPSARRFRQHENNRLAETLLIVDESSMIGLELMDHLLRALGDQARLVLLGDADQLPSVEPGAVFRDLCQEAGPAAAAVTRLDKSYRVDSKDEGGRRVAELARQIQGGGGESLWAAGGPISKQGHADAMSLSGVELLHGSRRQASLGQFLDRWYRSLFLDLEGLDRLTRRIYRSVEGSFREEDGASLTRLFAHLSSFKLLTVTRGERTPTGADAVNAALHRILLAHRGLPPDLGFQAGEPVIALKNDYERGLFNGDQAVIVSVAVDGELAVPMAVFQVDGRFLPFRLDALGEQIELAHALTVHKAQGSEYDRVGLILPEADLPLLNRELVYTAVTRARKSVSIAGDPELLLGAIQKRSLRSSGLAERI